MSKKKTNYLIIIWNELINDQLFLENLFFIVSNNRTFFILYTLYFSLIFLMIFRTVLFICNISIKNVKKVLPGRSKNRERLLKIINSIKARSMTKIKQITLNVSQIAYGVTVNDFNNYLVTF